MLLLKTQIENLGGSFITYQLRDARGTVRYVGVCRLNRLLHLPDIIKHPMFYYCFPAGEYVTIESLLIAHTRAECQRKRIEVVEQLSERPSLNVGDMLRGQHGLSITCDQTGEVFRTMQDVVDAHGCTLSALSKHLQGKQGYFTVRKRTYKRGLANV